MNKIKYLVVRDLKEYEQFEEELEMLSIKDIFIYYID